MDLSHGDLRRSGHHAWDQQHGERHWCHIISDTSLAELDAFLTLNVLTIGCLVTNVRTPLLGSNMTYAGLTDAQRTAAVAAGAIEQGRPYVLSHSFDAGANTWEP